MDAQKIGIVAAKKVEIAMNYVILSERHDDIATERRENTINLREHIGNNRLILIVGICWRECIERAFV